MKFRVKELSRQDLVHNPEELYEQELKEAQQVMYMESTDGEVENKAVKVTKDGKACSEKQQAQCRFCWGTESSVDNPCIVPCNCTGTVGFIHYMCLRNWLSLKMQSKETEQITTLFWKNFECELCKYAYPYLFKTKDRVYKLVDIQKPPTA